MKIKTLTAALALVAGLSTAQAATLTSALGDVFLGFRTAANSGSNLEVDLGSATQFSATGDNIINFSSRLSVNDLVATYGANWATSNVLTFDTFAGNSKTVSPSIGQPQGTIWLGAKRADVATLAAGPVRANAGIQGFVLDNINQFTTLASAPMHFNGKTSTANSDFAFVADGSQVGSYNSFAQNANTGSRINSFQKNMTGSLGTIGAGDETSSGTWSLLDFYVLNPGSGQGDYLGTFGLALADTTTADNTAYTAGTLLFQTNGATQFAAIPEPSTYAAILGALVLGFVILRRRQMIAA